MIVTTATFLLISYIVLMRLVIFAGDFNILAPLDGTDNMYERVFIGFICNLLFLMVFDVFYWRSCRQKCCSVCCCKPDGMDNTPTWEKLRGETMSASNSYRVSADVPYHRL